jgi:hypothetical protein
MHSQTIIHSTTILTQRLIYSTNLFPIQVQSPKLFQSMMHAVDMGLKLDRKKKTSPKQPSPTATLIDIDDDSKRLLIDDLQIPGFIPFPLETKVKTPYSTHSVHSTHSTNDFVTPRRKNQITPKMRHRSTSPKHYSPYSTPSYSLPTYSPTIQPIQHNIQSIQSSPKQHARRAPIERRSSMPNMMTLGLRPSVPSPSHQKTNSQTTAWESSTPEAQEEEDVTMHSPKPQRRVSLAHTSRHTLPTDFNDLLQPFYSQGNQELDLSPSMHSQSSPSQFDSPPPKDLMSQFFLHQPLRFKSTPPPAPQNVDDLCEWIKQGSDNE